MPSRDFNGAGDLIDFGNVHDKGDVDAVSWAVMAWVKATSSAAVKVVASKKNAAGTSKGYSLFVNV